MRSILVKTQIKAIDGSPMKGPDGKPFMANDAMAGAMQNQSGLNPIDAIKSINVGLKLLNCEGESVSLTDEELQLVKDAISKAAPSLSAIIVYDLWNRVSDEAMAAAQVNGVATVAG